MLRLAGLAFTHIWVETNTLADGLTAGVLNSARFMIAIVYRLRVCGLAPGVIVSCAWLTTQLPSLAGAV